MADADPSLGVSSSWALVQLFHILHGLKGRFGLVFLLRRTRRMAEERVQKVGESPAGGARLLLQVLVVINIFHNLLLINTVRIIMLGKIKDVLHLHV